MTVTLPTPVHVMCDVTPNQLKRKRTSSSSSDVDDADRNVADSDDQGLRRRVLELSLAKVRTAAPLTRSLRRREPPLLRSVLIINTLRAVDADRIFSDPTLCGAAVAPSTPYRAPSVLDELPGSLLRPLAAGDPLADARSADDASISAILDDLFGSERTSAAFQTPPVLTFSSLCELDCAPVWPPLTAAAVTSTSSASSPSSIDVDLDLDATMFDFDLLQPLTPAAAGCAGSRTTMSTPATSGGASCVLMTSAYTQRSQGFVDELEHMAEVLVGT